MDQIPLVAPTSMHIQFSHKQEVQPSIPKLFLCRYNYHKVSVAEILHNSWLIKTMECSGDAREVGIGRDSTSSLGVLAVHAAGDSPIRKH